MVLETIIKVDVAAQSIGQYLYETVTDD